MHKNPRRWPPSNLRDEIGSVSSRPTPSSANIAMDKDGPNQAVQLERIRMVLTRLFDCSG